MGASIIMTAFPPHSRGKLIFGIGAGPLPVAGFMLPCSARVRGAGVCSISPSAALPFGSSATGRKLAWHATAAMTGSAFPVKKAVKAPSSRVLCSG